MKKKLLSIFLAIVMAVVPMLFAGCEFDDDNETGSGGSGLGGSGGSGEVNSGSFYTQFLDGFKVVYSKSQIGQETEINKEINELYANFLSEFNKYYGSGSDNNNLATFFPDSIRQTIYQDTEGKAILANGGEIKNDKWLWTLNPNDNINVNDIYNELFKGNKYQEILQSVRNTLNNPTSNYPQLSTYYAKPLQIVLFETMLGYDQTVFEVEFVEDYEYKVPNSSLSVIDENYYKFAIKVKSSPNTRIIGKYVYYYETEIKVTYSIDGQYTKIQLPGTKLDCDEEINKYLGDWTQKTGLMGEYQNKATYSGLTKTDADALITYILNNVIGAEVVKNDYEQFGPGQNGDTFKKLLEYYTDENGVVDKSKINYSDGRHNYYNYRYYVGRVAEMVYSQVYDGSNEFVYTYKGNGFEIKYDYISEYKKQNGADALPDVNTASMRPQSASFLRDYDTDMFFPNADSFDIFGDSNSEAHSFDNSPMSEYQSVVLMPKESITLSGLWMQIFSPNPDLAINVYVRYYAYNKETGKGQLYTFTQNEINFYQSTPYDNAYEGRDCEYHKYVEGKGYLYKTTEKDNDGKKIEGYYADFEVTVDVTEIPPEFVEEYDRNDSSQIALDSVKIDEFNNSESDPKLKAKGTATNGIVEAKLDGEYAYKVIPSSNGFGGVTVLDERKIDFTFFEMVFDIQKDPTLASQNYDYKLSIVTPL